MKTTPLPGLAARWTAICPRCEEVVRVGDRIVFRRGEYVHVACAGGGQDE